MTRIAKKKETVRLNLEMSLQVRERLESLRERTDADSLTEVVRRSLAVYEFLQDGIETGGRVMLRRKDGTELEVALL